MAKESGLGWTTFSVDNSAAAAQDIRNDCRDLSFATPRAVQDVTGLDKSAIERLLLLADFSCDPSGVFNDDANKSHDVLSDCAATSVQRTVAITVSGQTLNNECWITDYALQRDEKGEFTWKAPMVLANGAVPTWSP